MIADSASDPPQAVLYEPGRQRRRGRARLLIAAVLLVAAAAVALTLRLTAGGLWHTSGPARPPLGPRPAVQIPGRVSPASSRAPAQPRTSPSHPAQLPQLPTLPASEPGNPGADAG
jgi:hypothetical protein